MTVTSPLLWRRRHGDVAASLRVVQTVRESGRLSESRTDCQRVVQTVRESGRLSEGRTDCQRVGQTVRGSGRLSEGRADCQRVGQTVRGSGRLSEGRADCQRVGQTVGGLVGGGKNGKPFFSVVTTTFLVIVFSVLNIFTHLTAILRVGSL